MIIRVLQFAPRRTLTGAVGALARCPVPRGLRPAVYGAFARAVGADPSEADRPLRDYATFQAFFTRGLRDGLRPIDPAPLVAPCDGTVIAGGTVEGGTLLQVKGRGYRLADLIGDAAEAARFEGGGYLTIYLAPRDYHRVHAPVDGQVTASRHIPGSLWPVGREATRRLDGLLAGNERLVTFIETDAGPLAVVMVAAFGVGTVHACYDGDAWRRLGPHRYHPAVPIARGEEIGAFRMGSTVVLLSTPDRPMRSIAAGAAVRMGQSLARADNGRTQGGPEHVHGGA